MTPTLEDHERRITVLEERMDQEAGLRASQDRDLSEMAAAVKANKDLLQALAVTQSEHTQTLAEHTQTLAEHTQTLAEHTQTLGELRAGMGRVENGMQQIVGKLDLLIEREGNS